MSGGSLCYTCYKIENNLVGEMRDPELDELMGDIAKVAHDLEWAIDSDITFDEYRETARKFKNKWFVQPREERLKGYIDKKLYALKNELYMMIGVKDNAEDNDTGEAAESE